MRSADQKVPRGTDRREILLLCNRAHMAAYLADVMNVLEGDDKLRFSLLRSFDDDRPDALRAIETALPVPLIRPLRAYAKKWDLIVTAHHTHKKFLKRKSAPVVYVGHAIGTGKSIKKGESYLFARRRVLHADGRPVYARIFTSSKAARDAAVEDNPLLADIATVVGDLRNDRLLAMQERRDEIRRQLGFAEGDRVVFVLSTYGPASFFESTGEAFLAAAEKLGPEYRFILSAHPNQYHAAMKPVSKDSRVWGPYLETLRSRRFSIREPDEAWDRYMTACDVVLSDHTSLALHAAPLGRPVLQIPLPEGKLEKGSLTWRLTRFAPKIAQDASDLGARIDEAMTQYSHEELRELAFDVNSCPGESEARIRDEIYTLLGLAPPTGADGGRAAEERSHRWVGNESG